MTTSTILTPGTWAIDPIHSTIGFTVRHLMVSKVRGRFHTFTGTITVADDGSPSIAADINVASISTDHAQRDAHLQTADFFEVDNHPTATFRSTSVQPAGSGTFVLTGDFTAGCHQIDQPPRRFQRCERRHG